MEPEKMPIFRADVPKKKAYRVLQIRNDTTQSWISKGEAEVFHTI